MALDDEVTRLIDSEVVYKLLERLTSGEPSRSETVEAFESFASLLKAHRLALRLLAREIEVLREKVES